MIPSFLGTLLHEVAFKLKKVRGEIGFLRRSVFGNDGVKFFMVDIVQSSRLRALGRPQRKGFRWLEALLPSFVLLQRLEGSEVR